MRFHACIIGMGRIGKRAAAILHKDGHIVSAFDPMPDEKAVPVPILPLPQDVALTDSLRAIKDRHTEPTILICTAPPAVAPKIAKAALDVGLPFVSSNFCTPEMRALDQTAQEKGLSLLTECGLDPGIDRFMLLKLLPAFDEIHSLNIFGAGVTDTQTATPLGYVFTWRPEGVMDACMRPARLLVKGSAKDIPPADIMAPDILLPRQVDGADMLAYPNGNAEEITDALQAAAPEIAAKISKIENCGCYSLRYPSFLTLITALKRLNMLSDAPILPCAGRTAADFFSEIAPGFEATLSEDENELFEKMGFDDCTPLPNDMPPTAPRYLIASLLDRALTLPPDHHDKIILLLEAEGLKDERPVKKTATLIKKGTAETSAMSETVARPLTIMARLTAENRLPPGLHTPLSLSSVTDDFFQALDAENYVFTES